MHSLIRRVLRPQLQSKIKVAVLKSSYLTQLLGLRYFALNDLDRKLEWYLNFDNGYFVELGANDGVNQSNTLYFEHFRNWTGTLIEPFLPNFKHLIRNRDSKNHFKHAACVGPTYADDTVNLAFSNLMTTTLDINSEIANPLEHAKSGSKFWGGKTHVFQAPACTLTSILIEANAPKFIDLLSLDVEGVELEVLKGLDHSVFRFRYICVESRQFDEISNFLHSSNYEFVEALSFHDFLFKSKDHPKIN